jgi:hypothetical protein
VNGTGGVEFPPPGTGFDTVMNAVPAVATSAGKSCAVSCVELPNVVERGLPLIETVENWIKFVPVTVSPSGGTTPTVVDVGEIEETVGTGFGTF